MKIGIKRRWNDPRYRICRACWGTGKYRRFFLTFDCPSCQGLGEIIPPANQNPSNETGESQ